MLLNFLGVKYSQQFELIIFLGYWYHFVKVKIDSGVDVKISGFERYTSITVDVFLVGIHRVVPLTHPPRPKPTSAARRFFPFLLGWKTVYGGVNPHKKGTLENPG